LLLVNIQISILLRKQLQNLKSQKVL